MSDLTYNKFIEAIKANNIEALVNLMTNFDTRFIVAGFADTCDTIYNDILVDMSITLFDTFCLWLPIKNSYEEYEVIKGLIDADNLVKLDSYMNYVADSECTMAALAQLYTKYPHLLKLFMERGYLSKRDIRSACHCDILCSDSMFDMLTDNFPMNYTDLLDMKLEYCYTTDPTLDKIIDRCTAVTSEQYHEILSNKSMVEYISVLFKKKIYPGMELFVKHHNVIIDNVPWKNIHAFLTHEA